MTEPSHGMEEAMKPWPHIGYSSLTAQPHSAVGSGQVSDGRP